jgi:GTP cyclohydrolase I
LKTVTGYGACARRPYCRTHDAEQRHAAEAMMDNNLGDLYAQILEGIGEDPYREGLQDTPERAARALLYLTRGYRQTLEEVVNNAIFESDNEEMILVKDIELYSLCEHHLLPFIGKCHVAYIPTGRVIGLSKIARIVDMFARRLQIQENLTKQIADTLMDVIAPAGVGVIIEARHLCMMMRGVEKQNSMLTTSMMLGSFRTHDRTRSEFLRLVRD